MTLFVDVVNFSRLVSLGSVDVGVGDEEEESRGVDGYGVADAEREMPRTSSRIALFVQRFPFDTERRNRHVQPAASPAHASFL